MSTSRERNVHASLFVAGSWRRPAEGGTLDVLAPAKGTTLAEIGYGTRRDAVEAADAASDAFPSWSRGPARAAFVEKLSERIGAMRLGDPMEDRAPQLGPLVEEKAQRTHEELIEEAERAGARRLTPELDRPDHGYFVQPALYGDVPGNAKLASTEAFSPVASVIGFEGEEEAIRQANATEMGLAGYLYTKDVSCAMRVAEALEVGTLGLNNPLRSVAFAPMGGVKQSGLGREGGHLGIDEFVETKYVCLDV